MQPTPPDEQIPGQEIFNLSVQELEERFRRLYTTVELTVKAITSYAQATHHNPPQATSVAGLESRLSSLMQALEQTVEAISTHAVVAQYSEQQWSSLSRAAREGIELLQTVTSGEDITPEWLGQRDARVTQMNILINGNGSFENTTEKG